MQVINVPNTANLRCACDSWKDHWMKFNPNGLAAMLQDNCSAVGCAGKFEHGGHVRLSGDTTVYIVPLCASCNSSENTKPYFIHEHVSMVPANPRVTCDRT